MSTYKCFGDQCMELLELESDSAFLKGESIFFFFFTELAIAVFILNKHSGPLEMNAAFSDEVLISLNVTLCNHSKSVF